MTLLSLNTFVGATLVTEFSLSFVVNLCQLVFLHLKTGKYRLRCYFSVQK